MIEITLTDIALLVWAGIATAAAFHYRAQHEAARHFVHALLKDKDLRDKVVADWEEFNRREA